MAKTLESQTLASTAGERIKIFGGSNITALEAEIDKWFAEWPNIKVIERLLSTSIVPSQGDGSFVYVTITIFYRESFQPKTELGNQSYKTAKEQVVNQFELDYLTRLIQGDDENLSRISKRAGIERAYLRDLLRKHGLRVPGES